MMQRTLILLAFAAWPLAAQQHRLGHADDESHMAQMEEMMARGVLTEEQRRMIDHRPS
jgi:hypothetical protein